MATIPIVQLFRNSNIISGRSAAIDALEAQKAFVADGGLILATYSSDNGVKTLLGIVRNSGSENAQLTIMDVEGAAKNVQDAIDALSAYTNTKLTEEKNAREAADTTLQTNIDNVNSALTAHTANTTVHVTQADKDKWNTPTDLSNYYKKAEVDEKDAAINATIEAYGHVTSQALNDLGTRMDDYGQVTSQALNDLGTKFGDYYTKAEVDSKDATINATIEALSSDTKNKIDAEASARQEADNTLQGNINNVNSSLTAHTANTTVHVTQADKDKWNTPTDLSNYYKKAEVDGKDATLQTALDALDAHVSENEDIVSRSLNDLNNRIGDTYVKSYIDALEARIAELETKFLNMENNGLQAGEY